MNQRRIASAATLQQSRLTLRLLPGISVVALTILSMVEWPVISSLLPANPALFVVGIVFFTLWQPRYLPNTVVFGCGLFYDALQPSYLGTYALLFLMLRLGVVWMRQHSGYPDNLLLNWLTFSACALAFFIAEWAAISLQLHDSIFSMSLLMRDGLTLVVYPLAFLLFTSIIASLQSGGG